MFSIKMISLLAAASATTATTLQPVDVAYRHDDRKAEILQPYDGFGYWQLQARCAGVMDGFAANYESRRRTRTAASAAEARDYFAREARARLVQDRRIDEGAAEAVMANYIRLGRRHFDEAMDLRSATGGVSPSNMQRSECVELYREYQGRQTAQRAPEILRTDNTRIVCEEYMPAGARQPARECRVAREWELIREESQEMRRQIEQGGAIGSGTDQSVIAPGG